MLRIVASAAGALLLVACAKPYALNVNEANFKGPQSAAAIVVSDPQIYARETLINDRREERDYLQRLLSNSEKVQFSPQLRRSLRDIQAFQASAAVSFDPAKALEARQVQDLSKLKNELEQTQLRTQILQAQRQYNQLAATELGTDSDKTVPSDPTASRQGNQVPVTAPTPPDISTRMKSVETALGQLRTKLTDLNTDTAQRTPETAVVNDPHDEFRDREAYRSEIRSALSAINLDDLHDFSGNVLYRLQFRATVMPGELTDQFGVARVSLQPPKDLDLRELYAAWLGRTTYRLNKIYPDGAILIDQVERGLGTAGLFEVVEEKIRVTDGDKDCAFDPDACVTIGIAVPPLVVDFVSEALRLNFQSEIEAAKNWRNLLNDIDARSPDFRRYLEIKRDGLYPCQLQIFDTQAFDNEMFTSNYTSESFSNRFALAQQSLLARRILPASLQGFSDPSWPPAVSKGINRLLSNLNLANRLDDIFLRWVFRNAPDMQVACTEVHDATRPTAGLPSGGFYAAPYIVPSVFISTLVEHLNGGDVRSVYGYGSRPFERGHRVSTITSAASSLELGLALSAALATKGVGAGLDVGYMRSVAGNAEALERIPAVVAFSDGVDNSPKATKESSPPGTPAPAVTSGLARILAGVAKDFEVRTTLNSLAADATTKREAAEMTRFGWVFGPKPRLDPVNNRITLTHTVANHDVAADVSLPGWWPYVIADIETAWIANWYRGGETLTAGEQTKKRTLKIPLPVSSANLDALSAFLARKTVGGALNFARIATVEPAVVSACADQVRFLIFGSNLWRSTEVQLGGLGPNGIVQVLPDMEGVAAVFDIGAVMGRLNRSPGATAFESVNLVVSTRNHSDTVPIRIVGRRHADGTCAAASIGSQPRGNVFSILNVVPGEIGLCHREAFAFATVPRSSSTTYEAWLGSAKAGIAETLGQVLTRGPSLAQHVRDLSTPSNSTVVLKLGFLTAPLRTEIAARGNAGDAHDVPLIVSNGNSVASTTLRVRGCGETEAGDTSRRISVTAVGRTAITDNKKLRIIARTGAAVPAFDEADIAVRPAGDPHATAQRVGDPLTRQELSRARDIIRIADAADAWPYENGTPLTVMLRIRPTPSADFAEHPAASPVFYFKSKDAASVTLKETTTGDTRAITGGLKPDTEIKLQLPANMVSAWPGMKSDTVPVLQYDGTESKMGLSVTGSPRCTEGDPLGERLCAYTLQAADTAAFAAAVKNKTVTYKIAWPPGITGPQIIGKIEFTKL